MPRAVLRLRAVLYGIGCQADCILETWKDISSAGKVFTRAVIGKERPNLPDGIYMLVLGHQSTFVRKYEGAWRLIFLPPEFEIETEGLRAA
jgi:hypothetical protein